MADDKKVDSSDNFKAIMKSLYSENNSIKKSLLQYRLYFLKQKYNEIAIQYEEKIQNRKK